MQVLAQLVFISDATMRSVHLAEHDRTKPGRQEVTFLLLCNLALWIVYTMEIDKVEANPVQVSYAYQRQICMEVSFDHYSIMDSGWH